MPIVPLLALTLSYALLARLGLALATVHGTIAVLWPASGLGVAVLLRFGPRLWPALPAAMLLTHWWVGNPLGFALASAFGSTAEALAGAWLLGRGRDFHPGLDRLRDVVSLTGRGALAATSLSATAGVAGLWAAGLVPAADAAVGWLSWWLGNATGVLLLAPIILVWRNPRRLFLSPDQEHEALLLILLLLLVAGFAFSGRVSAPGLGYLLTFLPLPLVIWAGVRFGPGGVAITNLVLVGSATWFTTQGLGPFYRGDLASSLSLLWGYQCLWLLSGLCLAALVSERAESVRRSGELARVNEQLIAEVGERQRAEAALTHERDFSNAVLDVVGALVLVLDREGRIHRFNRACERLTGYHFAEAEGRSVWDLLLPPEEREAVRGVFSRLVAGQFPSRYENVWVTRNGEPRRIRWANTCLVDAAGAVEFVIATGIDITEQHQAEERTHLFRQLLDHTDDAFFVLDPASGCVLDANRSAWERRGFRREELLSSTVVDLSATTTDLAAWHRVVDKLAQNCQLSLEADHRRRDGSLFPVEVNMALIDTEERQRVVAMVRDVGERRRTEEELRLAASVFEDAREAVMITDMAGHILKVNPAFTRTTGYDSGEVLGRTPRVLRSDRHDTIFYEKLFDTLREKGRWQGEIWDRRKDGRLFPAWESITAVRDGANRPIRFISIFTDLTEKHLDEARIYHLAHYDPLTDLPNRALFHERLEQGIVQSQRYGHMLALLYLDLDRFKRINDTLGHGAGDQLLQQVAVRLAGCVREADTVARLGGDEFTILLNEVHRPEDAEIVARKVLTALRDPCVVEGHELFVTTSIGITLCPRDAQEGHALLQNADAAMYEAKELGRNSYRFYTQDINQVASERIQLESGLRHALQRGEFHLVYQPQVDLRDGRVVALEALLRWESPERGLVPPGAFIPVAEDTGLILPIGAWVLAEACRQHQAFAAEGIAPLSLAINISGRQFRDPDLLTHIETALAESGMAPTLLELEITETYLMSSAEESTEMLEQLRSLGIRVSIDDFGIAYSSLNYLKRFPIDKLKIDQSFVRHLPRDPDDAAIAATIIAMGHGLNLRVIAEGVETDEQLAFLRERGCDELQGYYFCPPLGAEECRAFLRQDPRLMLD